MLLQPLYHLREAHAIFVTGLEFAPQKSATMAITGNHDFTLFSISADNQVKMHQEAPRSKYLIVVCIWILALNSDSILTDHALTNITIHTQVLIHCSVQKLACYQMPNFITFVFNLLQPIHVWIIIVFNSI